jgi:hypothetical protein
VEYACCPLQLGFVDVIIKSILLKEMAAIQESGAKRTRPESTEGGSEPKRLKGNQAGK